MKRSRHKTKKLCRHTKYKRYIKALVHKPTAKNQKRQGLISLECFIILLYTIFVNQWFKHCAPKPYRKKEKTSVGIILSNFFKFVVSIILKLISESFLEWFMESIILRFLIKFLESVGFGE